MIGRPLKDLSIDLQVLHSLRSMPSAFSHSVIKHSKKVIWIGELQPSSLGKSYKIRIEYTYGKRPIVTLPEENFNGKRPPHTFKDYSLCLYHRFGVGAWNGRKYISELLPMIAHWLWCYEMWQITGKWHGEEYLHLSNLPKEQ